MPKVYCHTYLAVPGFFNEFFEFGWTLISTLPILIVFAGGAVVADWVVVVGVVVVIGGVVIVVGVVDVGEVGVV
jgi:hypothetical protein